MIIEVVDWRRGGLLFQEYGLPYTMGQQVEGGYAEAMRIAEVCFSKGLNVMVARARDHTEEAPHILVAVDTFRFTQR